MYWIYDIQIKFIYHPCFTYLNIIQLFHFVVTYFWRKNKHEETTQDWSVSTIVNALTFLFADVLKRYACEKARWCGVWTASPSPCLCFFWLMPLFPSRLCRPTCCPSMVSACLPVSPLVDPAFIKLHLLSSADRHHTCQGQLFLFPHLPIRGRSVVPFFACWCHNVAWNLLQGRIGAQAAWFRLWSCRARKTFSLSMSQPWECGAWELGTQRGMRQCSHVQPTANELCMVLHRASHLCLNLFPRWRPWAWFPS